LGTLKAMESPRTCPTCAAPAEARQRWCLECGGELPQSRRGALRPAVGIATTLAVLVGAASAGGYTILHHDRQPPPPATTVAQAAPPTSPATTTPSVAGSGLGGSSPGSSFGSPGYSTTTSPPLASSSQPTHFSTKPEIGKVGGASPSTHPTTHHTSTTTTTSSSDGSVTESGSTHTTTTPKTLMALVNVAVGEVAVAYAPYASATLDLGDPTLADDGTTRTAWRTPTFADPATKPQLGVYVDLGTPTQLRKLVLQTPTPGMGVEIYGATKGPPATITDPGWTHLATRRSLARKTTIGLAPKSWRYVLVWVTGLPAGAHRAAISELQLLSLQPE
jgi:hypothetical protein